jgi:hypothetical protein
MMAEADRRGVSMLKQISERLKYRRKRRVVQEGLILLEPSPMLTLMTLALALTQTPPAPPPPPEREVRVHVLTQGGPDGRGLDRDGDGQVTRDEFSAPMNDTFGRLDKDGDGRLSTEELSADHGPGDPVVMLNGPDGPGPHRFELRVDGEDGGPGERREVRVFTRGDGEAPVVLRQGEPGGPFWIDGESHDGRFELHRIDGAGDGPGDLDKDGDGKVSEAEFTAPLRDAFARMDADHSGFIEEGERGEDSEVRVITRRVDHRED